MPHIKTKTELTLGVDLNIDDILLHNAIQTHPGFNNKGKLEYFIARLVSKFMSTRGIVYNDLHDATYACHHVGDEFRRLYLDKREDEAIKANGNAFES